MQRGEKVLLENLNLSVRRGERVALVGANGSGKSTLLETVLGRLGTHAGEVVYGHGLEVYWSGQHGEELDAFETLQDALLAAQKELRLQDIYILLANLGLPKDPLHLVRSLSGGERTRLSLARLSVTRAHLLVLDEPTNHLDIHAIEALEDLLVNYPGTVLFASHDRRLVARVATRRLDLGTADPAGTG
ncbi:MAG: ATP-binding cassette domain-containing protein [Deinococcota bacterium]|nr:ATP-binding cassette domain-containing protein [Deinococcota bacterium]